MEELNSGLKLLTNKLNIDCILEGISKNPPSIWEVKEE